MQTTIFPRKLGYVKIPISEDEKAQYGNACALSTVLIVIVLVIVSIMRFVIGKLGVSTDDQTQLI